MRNLLKLRWVLILLPVVIMTGCSFSNIEPGEMVADPKIVKHHPGSVQVRVSGGAGKDDSLKITDDGLKQAVVNAINKSKLFERVAANGAKYRLDVILADVQQPAAGFAMTVGITINWIVTRVSDNKAIWRESIFAARRLTPADELGGVARLRRATGEAAARNIDKAFAKISKLDL